jgi:hypothetical protein
MRAGLALAVFGFLAGCSATRPPVYRETRTDLPTRSYVSVERLAQKLDLEYLGESRGGIEMTGMTDYVMLIPESRSAFVNGQPMSLVLPCIQRGTDYVVSAGDAESITAKLATLRSSRPAPPPPLIVQADRLPHPSGLPSEWRPNATATPRDWQAIVIHHAAQESGDAASIGRVHRDVNKWDGLGYHFVIGNGTQSGNGEIEVGFRWREQREGAHARARAGDDNRWNLHGIGICLVGDFTNVAPSPAQMDALVRLVRALMAEYHLDAKDVFPHKIVHDTECPGARFPWAQFISRLR